MRSFQLTLVVTHACDLACTYCSAGPKDSRRMDEATGRRAIERALASVDRGGTLDLGFFGGEPLLEWPLVRALTAFARAERPDVTVTPSLTTNGSRVEARLARELVEDGVATSLSIDGLPEVHDEERRTVSGRGSAGRALRALEHLLAAGAEPTIVSVVRPSNVDRLVEGLRFLASRGARFLQPSLDWRAPWRRADGERLARAVGELGRLFAERFPELSISWLDSKVALLTGALPGPIACGFGKGEVAVAPSGRLYPCERLVEDDRAGAWSMGNVRDGEGPFAPHPASCVPAGGSACGGCATRFACSNGCACANLARTGRIDGPDGLVCLLEQACLDAAREALRAVEARSVA